MIRGAWDPFTAAVAALVVNLPGCRAAQGSEGDILREACNLGSISVLMLLLAALCLGHGIWKALIRIC